MYKNLFKLNGKTAIVTGGVGVLGKEFSTALADFGANVVIVDINKESVDEFVKKLQKTSTSKIIGLVCDVSDKSYVDLMVSNVISEFGCIDIFICVDTTMKHGGIFLISFVIPSYFIIIFLLYL